MAIIYLSTLKEEIIKNNVTIIEYRPTEDYDGTKDFLNRIDKQLVNLQLRHNKQQDVVNKKKYPFYCKIGVLFAKGQIQLKKQKFYYLNNSFTSIAKLSKYIQAEILKTNKNVRQYINDTIYNTGTKNFYSSYTMMKNIVNYCNENSIEINNEFKGIYNELEKLH